MKRRERRRFPVAGIALAVVVAMGAPSSAQPPNYNRWTGSTAMSQPQGFSQGSPLTLTWGFMAPGTSIGGGSYPVAPNNLQTRLNAIYGNQGVWQPLFQSVFDRWSSISGLSYQFEANDDGAAIGASFPTGVLGVRADVRIGGKPLDGNSGVLAYNYFPNVGEMVFDTNDTFYNTTTSNSLRLRNVTSHEHGHGMGMPHVESNNANFLLEPFFSAAFDGPQYHDVLAAQRMYGDAREKSNGGAGNDTSANANLLGTLNATLSIGNSARTLAVAPTATDFVSIDDTNDIDFYSFDVAAPLHFNVRLDALGFLYNLTPQGSGGAVPFDSRLRSDLALALFDTNGATLLASANLNGLGMSESIAFSLFTVGRYFLRVTGLDNADASAFDAQFYGLTLNFTPAPEPATWALVATAGLMVVRRRRIP